MNLRIGADKIRNIVCGDLERGRWLWKGLLPWIHAHGEAGEVGGRRWELYLIEIMVHRKCWGYQEVWLLSRDQGRMDS